MSDTQLKKGCFENEGLDLTIKEYSSGKAAAESMLNGEVDIYLRLQICLLCSIASAERISASFQHLPPLMILSK